jgi:hypothetical protein
LQGFSWNKTPDAIVSSATHQRSWRTKDMTNYETGYTLEDRARIRTAPAFEGRDIVAIGLATVMMLGPLAAYALGWGG